MWDTNKLKTLDVIPFDATANADTIAGWDGVDRINGLDGNDTLNGNGGNDILDGGTGWCGVQAGNDAVFKIWRVG